MTPTEDASITYARQEGRRKAIEECCLALCSWCRDEVALHQDKRAFYHIDADGLRVICDAEEVRWAVKP